MTVKAQKPIVIFRGDNTAAFDLRTITILLTGDLDLSQATAKFTLLDFSKTWTEQEVATGELSIVFTAEQTKAFALGPQTGTLRLYDMSTGTPRQLTIVNKIPFFITNRVCDIENQNYEADVCVTSGEVIHVEFNVGLIAIAGKADKVGNATAGDLASLTADGNLEDSGIPKTDVLRKTQMDSTPTAGSQNPVTSDGIKQAIEAATPSDYDQVKQQVQTNANSIAAINSKIPSGASSSNHLVTLQELQEATPSDYDQVKQQVATNTQNISRNAGNIADNTNDISGIKAKIPAQASAQNQLADKAFVNSSIATNTATFRGSYNLVSDLGLTVLATEQQVAAAIATKLAALSITPENNDYCFVQVPKTNAEPTVIERVDRYKCTVTESGGVTTRVWEYEWSLNNSSFTADQWAAINSGITSGDVAKLGALPTAQELATALGAKYEKPSGGIPKTDLSSGVQSSLDKADTALQTAPVISVNSKTGAVTLTASDVGALGNSGNQMLDGSINASGFFASSQLIVGTSNNGVTCSISDSDPFYINVVVKRGGNTVTTYKFPRQELVDAYCFARLVDFYAAVQQIAPAWVSGTSYAAGTLVTYNGVLYQNTSGTTIQSTTTPNTQESGWTATKVSELLALLAPLASPAFTGTPTAPTPTAGDNSTKVATTAFVKGALPYAIASVPSGDALADRTVNTKTVNAATYAPSFPAETSGKSCDFYLAITSDTAGTVSAPSGKTLNNAKGESANLDYEANKTTVLRFTQIGANTYVVTGGANGGGNIAWSGNKTPGNLVTQDANGNLADAGVSTGEVLRYALGAAQTISTASQDSSGGTTINYGEATLADRTANQVAVTASLDELRVSFPAAVSNKVRDFELRLEIGTGSAALTAPAIVVVPPTSETITLENSDGAWPTLEDGTATAKGVTTLYFSETATGKFLVKGEAMKEVA